MSRGLDPKGLGRHHHGGFVGPFQAKEVGGANVARADAADDTKVTGRQYCATLYAAGDKVAEVQQAVRLHGEVVVGLVNLVCFGDLVVVLRRCRGDSGSVKREAVKAAATLAAHGATLALIGCS